MSIQIQTSSNSQIQAQLTQDSTATTLFDHFDCSVLITQEKSYNVNRHRAVEVLACAWNKGWSGEGTTCPKWRLPSTSLSGTATPALATMISNPPNVDTVVWTASLTFSSFATSACMVRALRPRASTSLRTSSRRSYTPQ